LYNLPSNDHSHTEKVLCFARCLGGTYQLIQRLGWVEETYKTILFKCLGPIFKNAKGTLALLVNNIMLWELHDYDIVDGIQPKT